MNQLNQTTANVAGNLVSCSLIDLDFAAELLDDFTENYLGKCNLDSFISDIKDRPDLVDAKLTAIYNFITSAKDKLREADKIFWGDEDQKTDTSSQPV